MNTNTNCSITGKPEYFLIEEINFLLWTGKQLNVGIKVQCQLCGGEFHIFTLESDDPVYMTCPHCKKHVEYSDGASW